MNLEDINPMQWLAINIANQYGHNGVDKLNHEDQIEWVKHNMDDLESFVGEEPAQYVKAVKALRDAQKGLPVNIPIGQDASNSGIQIMSAMTNCLAGATATNLIDPTQKVDGYAIGTEIYNRINNSDHKFSRNDVKLAIMAFYYGSEAIPKELFGEGKNLESFYKAMQELSPNSYRLLQILVGSWNPEAEYHYWMLPDGFEVKIPSLVKNKHELIHPEIGVPTVIYKEVVEAQDYGVSNAANLVHSYDAYVLRTVERRLNHDIDLLEKVRNILYAHKWKPVEPRNQKNMKMVQLYNHSKMVDTRFLHTIDYLNVGNMRAEHRRKLLDLIERLLNYKPFKLMTVHDDYRSLPSNVTRMNIEYREVLADLSESNALNFSLGFLGCSFPVGSPLGSRIRKSNYALS